MKARPHEMYTYRYHQRQQIYEREFKSLDAALQTACDDLEAMNACPEAILRNGNVSMNLYQLVREWEMRRNWLTPFAVWESLKP